MQAICFSQKDRIEEDKDRHREVWPEMREALRRTGWGNSFSARSMVWRRSR